MEVSVNDTNDSLPASDDIQKDVTMTRTSDQSDKDRLLEALRTILRWCDPDGDGEDSMAQCLLEIEDVCQKHLDLG